MNQASSCWVNWTHSLGTSMSGNCARDSLGSTLVWTVHIIQKEEDKKGPNTFTNITHTCMCFP